MQEIQTIIAAQSEASRQQKETALATVVRVSGSAYRRPGARMLITSDGQTTGSISGGCLEKDAALQAQRVFTDGKPILIHYSTTGSDDEIVFGLGSGCNGRVDIFIERIDKGKPADPDQLMFLSACHDNRDIGVIATITSVADGSEGLNGSDGSADLDRSGDVKAGGKMFFSNRDVVESSIKNAEVATLLTSLAQEALHARRSSYHEVVTGSIKLEVCIEFVEPPVQLLICGNGKDTIPLTAFATHLGWQFQALEPGCQNIAGATSEFRCPERIAAVIMTHNYSHDLRFLKDLITRSDIGYIGLLGPKHRSQKLMQELLAQGIAPAEEQLRNFHAPVGLDLGAESEAEVALSIVSEIEAVMCGRAGSFLRDRKDRIHTDSSFESDRSTNSSADHLIEFPLCQAQD